MSKIYFGGSRHLQAPSPLVASVVQSVLAAGHSVHVGCCVGADALVIQSALVCFVRSSLVVFAVSHPSGKGAFSLSSSMPGFAQKAGAVVHWQAGGSLSVPLRGRLISRSLAALAGCSAAVFFSPGSGSLAVASHAVSQSIPVFAFQEQAPAPVPGCAGQWVQSSFQGLPCWSWQSAQLSFI